MTVTSRQAGVFAAIAAKRRSALITYLMAGDPDPAESALYAWACIAGGADIVELGIPFSDPLADGPVLQRAAERALATGTRLADVLGVAGSLRRETETPIVLMGYLNPILRWGRGNSSRPVATAASTPSLSPTCSRRRPGASPRRRGVTASAPSSWSRAARPRRGSVRRARPPRPSSISRQWKA